MLSRLVQVKAQASLANAEPYFFFLKTTKTLHTNRSEKILIRSNRDKEQNELGFFRHSIQKEDSLSLTKTNKKNPNKQQIKIPNSLGITSIRSKEILISNLINK
jgi:hypothetical protein